MGDFLFGSDPSVSYGQSPQATQLYNLMYPMLEKAMTGGQTWNIPGYDIPDPYKLPDQVAPTAGWYNSISPEIKEGLWEPYEQGADMLGERMGSQGQMGSARGGYTGTAGDSFGRYYADASKDIGMNAWNMMQPGMQANYQAELGQNQGQWAAQLGQNQGMWQQQLQQNMYPYNILGGMMGMSMPNTIVNPGQTGAAQSAAPYAAMYGLGKLFGW